MKKTRVSNQWGWLAVAAGLAATASVAYGSGADSSGGGKLRTDETNPWFLGSAPIEYCVEVGAGFPLSESRVRAEIAEAFAEWKAVYKRYGLYQKALPGKFADGISRALTVDAEYVPLCTNPDHQLRFKVGLVDEEMEKYFESNSKLAVGDSYRGPYDHQTFRSGGFIWIAPNNWASQQGSLTANFPQWEFKRHFQAILLHEIGHVLGFPHLKNTVMDELIFSFLQMDHAFPDGTPGALEVSGKIEAGMMRLNPQVPASPLVSNEPYFCQLARYHFHNGSGQKNCGLTEFVWTSAPQHGELLIRVKADERTYDLPARIYSYVGHRFSWEVDQESLNFFSKAYRSPKGGWLEKILPLSAFFRSYPGSVNVNGTTYPFLISFGAKLRLDLNVVGGSAWFPTSFKGDTSLPNPRVTDVPVEPLPNPTPSGSPTSSPLPSPSPTSSPTASPSATPTSTPTPLAH